MQMLVLVERKVHIGRLRLRFIYLYSAIETDKSYLQRFTVKQSRYSDIQLQVIAFLKIESL